MKLVRENINFEKGIDPKTALGLGYPPGKEIDFAYWQSRGYGSTLPSYMVLTKAIIEEANGNEITIKYQDEYGREKTVVETIQGILDSVEEYHNDKKRRDEVFSRRFWGS